MKILTARDSLNQIITNNPGKRIGKFSLERVIFEKNKKLHPGYKSIVETLRADGCQIIVADVMNFGILIQKLRYFKDIELSLYEFPDIILENKNFDNTIQSLDYYLNIDYLVIYEQDWYDYMQFSNVDLQLNSDRIQTDDFEGRHLLSQSQFAFFEFIALMYSTTMEGVNTFTLPFVYALPQKPTYMHIYAEKEFRENYYQNEVLIAPWPVDKDKIPYSLSTKDLFAFSFSKNAGIKEFASYIDSSSFEDLLDDKKVGKEAKKQDGEIVYYNHVDVNNAIFIVFKNENNIEISFHVVQ